MSSLVSSCISPSLPFSAFFCLFSYCIQLHRLAQRGAVRAQFLNSSYSTMLLHQSQISNQSTTKAMASFQVYIYIYIYMFLFFWINYCIFFFNQGSVWQSLQKCVMFSREKKKKAFAVFVGCLVSLLCGRLSTLVFSSLYKWVRMRILWNSLFLILFSSFVSWFPCTLHIKTIKALLNVQIKHSQSTKLISSFNVFF